MASKPICPVDIFTPWRWFSTSLISCPLSCEQSHPAHIHWCDLMCITSSMAWCLTPLQSRTKKKQHHLRLTKSQGFYFIWLFYFGSVMLTTFYFHCIEYTHIQYVYMCPRRKKQRQKLSDDLEPCIACFHDKTCFFFSSSMGTSSYLYNCGDIICDLNPVQFFHICNLWSKNSTANTLAKH